MTLERRPKERKPCRHMAEEGRRGLMARRHMGHPKNREPSEVGQREAGMRPRRMDPQCLVPGKGTCFKHPVLSR